MKMINILVTLDDNYIPYLNVMIESLLYHNQNCFFHIYWIHSAVSEEKARIVSQTLGIHGSLHMLNAREEELEAAPTTSRYPKEMYYRIFAVRYLPPDIDRVLYLDPDIIINGSLQELYELPLDGYYFAAASHVGNLLTIFNSIRLDMNENTPYINSGVMLMNLKNLRKEQKFDEVFDFIREKKNVLMLPDQDIISSLYGHKILAIDPLRYNMTEKLYQKYHVLEQGIDLDWVRSHSAIIHYCGRNKPWKDNYAGMLDVFYKEAVSRLKGENMYRGG